MTEAEQPNLTRKQLEFMADDALAEFRDFADSLTEPISAEDLARARELGHISVEARIRAIEAPSLE